MKLTYVPPLQFHSVWPQIERLVTAAYEQLPTDYTVEQCKVFLANGTWTLLVWESDAGVICGAITLDIFNRPNDKIGHIQLHTGSWVTSPETVALLVQEAKKMGITKIRAQCRESVTRLVVRHGFVQTHSVIELDT